MQSMQPALPAEGSPPRLRVQQPVPRQCSPAGLVLVVENTIFPCFSFSSPPRLFSLFSPFFSSFKTQNSSKQYYRIIDQHEKGLGVFWVYTTNKKCGKPSNAGGSQSPTFRICMDYTKTWKDIMCRLAFYPGVTSLWIIPPDATGAYFSYAAFWIADSPINRATVILRLHKCKHRCSSTKKHPHLFAFWAKQFLIRICWFIYFKTLSILRLLPVTQGDYMMAWSPWKQWTNLRCFHCCR